MFSAIKRKIFVTVLLSVFVPAFFSFAQSPVTPQGVDRLKSQIERLIDGVDGQVGVAVKHLETGRELAVNGDVYFPMASVFKLPVLVEVMHQIKEGRFTLDDEIRLEKTDQHLGSGYLSDLDIPGVVLSVRNLINFMMMISDNSAADILLVKVGAENVNNRLRSYGIEKITVDRTCQQLIMDAMGIDYEKYKNLTLDELSLAYRKERKENPQASEQAAKQFSQVMKDQSSPRAMNRLLELVFKKEIVDEQSSQFILDVMLKCQTGGERLKGDLPRFVRVAHKTGSLGGVINDAGIIYLPDDLGHVAVTVFSKDTEDPAEDVEEVIAQIARFVYDYFYFTVGD